MFILFVLIGLAGPGSAQDKEGTAKEELSADEVAKQLANPNTPLASLTLYRLLMGASVVLPDYGDVLTHLLNIGHLYRHGVRHA